MYDELNRAAGAHEPTEFAKSPKKAAASGWIGSVLEYYDFSIYAQAAALVFPTVFFPKGNATVALVPSLATYAVATWPDRSVPRSSGTGGTGTAGRTSW